MSRIHPAVYERLVERYKEQAEVWAHACIDAGLSEHDLKDASKFAEFEALKPVDIVDWFKRRAARNTRWRAVVTPAIVEQLLEVRSWAQSQDENIQKQAQIVCVYVDLMTNAARFFKIEGR